MARNGPGRIMNRDHGTYVKSPLRGRDVTLYRAVTALAEHRHQCGTDYLECTAIERPKQGRLPLWLYSGIFSTGVLQSVRNHTDLAVAKSCCGGHIIYCVLHHQARNPHMRMALSFSHEPAPAVHRLRLELITSFRVDTPRQG